MATDTVGGMKVPKPQPNTPTSMDAVKTQATANGHNTFRPDIYRVSEGYVV